MQCKFYNVSHTKSVKIGSDLNNSISWRYRGTVTSDLSQRSFMYLIDVFHTIKNFAKLTYKHKFCPILSDMRLKTGVVTLWQMLKLKLLLQYTCCRIKKNVECKSTTSRSQPSSQPSSHFEMSWWFSGSYLAYIFHTCTE